MRAHPDNKDRLFITVYGPNRQEVQEALDKGYRIVQMTSAAGNLNPICFIYLEKMSEIDGPIESK